MEISGDDADFSGNTSSTSLIYFPRRFLVYVGVVKAKHGNGRSHHIHWIGSFWRRLDEIDHWHTVTQSNEPVDEPIERLRQAVAQHSPAIAADMIGQTWKRTS